MKHNDRIYLAILFKNKKAAPKIMPPILWSWPMMSKADAGGAAVEVGPLH